MYNNTLKMKSSIKANMKELQTYSANPKYQDSMNELLTLYKTRKIENIRTATKIAEKLSTKGKGSAGAAKKAIQMLAKYRTYQPATGKIERNFVKKNTKTWIVAGKMHTSTQYLYTNKKTGKTSKQKEVFHDVIPFNREIQATSKEEAVKQMNELLYRSERRAQGEGGGTDGASGGVDSGEFKYVDVDSIDINFVDSKEGVAYASEANTPMKNMSFCEYAFIPSDNKHLKNDGFCVVDNFLGIYSPKIKKLTRELFVEIVTQITKPKLSEVANPLDEGEDVVDISDGITPEVLRDVCKHFDISHYSYDFTNKCFLKYVSKSSNYEPLVYYAVNGHMYWIGDKDEALSLIARARTYEDNNKKVNSYIFDEYECKNKFLDRQIYDNIPIDKLSECKGGVNIISKTNLNEELSDYIKHYNVIPDSNGIRNDTSKITQFHDEVNDVILAIDPNDTRHYTYKNVVKICKDKDIEFRNQSLMSVVKTMRENFMNVNRVRFDKPFRLKLYKQQGKCCQLCKNKLEINYVQIDHIKALANGGTNDIENLQILCKPCHYVKTKEEAENGWVKESDTQSSFNSQTDVVFNSELSKVWAFVEKKTKEDKDNNNKLFGFDINKCRKNEMVYNKCNYPLFTEMDKE